MGRRVESCVCGEGWVGEGESSEEDSEDSDNFSII